MKTGIRVGIVSAIAVIGAVASSADVSAGVQPRFCKVSTAAGALAAQPGADGPRQPRGVVLLGSQDQIAPGNPIYARLANFGQRRATYGREFAIEHFSDDGWAIDPASPDGPWVKVAGVLRPSIAGRCYRFDVPMGQDPGLYRFSTSIRQPGAKDQQRRVAEFRVR